MVGDTYCVSKWLILILLIYVFLLLIFHFIRSFIHLSSDGLLYVVVKCIETISKMHDWYIRCVYIAIVYFYNWLIHMDFMQMQNGIEFNFFFLCISVESMSIRVEHPTSHFDWFWSTLIEITVIKRKLHGFLINLPYTCRRVYTDKYPFNLISIQLDNLANKVIRKFVG